MKIKTWSLLAALLFVAGLTVQAQTNIITASGAMKTTGTIPGWGSYVGYANYTKPNPAWGWVTNAHVMSASTTTTDTFTAYTGKFGDAGLGIKSVTFTNVSPKYRFTVYFRQVYPTNAATYPLQTVGLLP